MGLNDESIDVKKKKRSRKSKRKFSDSWDVEKVGEPSVKNLKADPNSKEISKCQNGNVGGKRQLGSSDSQEASPAKKRKRNKKKKNATTDNAEQNASKLGS